ncbi:response regulator transcription factor [Nocardioides guangzhouensis]|uniref:Response regulator transcription factor n=1 Tax=Nocardioides guangzhouensis TaxID=2497878 RepID=A0A4Q4ZES3_9ACTN|nr:response regulator transcription factor [Nocardioides guangzhouensis]RYP86268.1 response regulator transcription factor [Nocardioides guangzhouensis]
MIRVLLADDQELVREGFATILDLQPDIEVVASVADGVDAVTVARDLAPDVVLMDVRMPAMDGIEATRRLLRSGAADAPRVLVLTMFDLDEYVFAALRAGASGFLLKDTPRAGLIAAVRAVASGETLLSPSVTRRLVEQFAERLPAGSSDSEWLKLSPRELDVARLMARGLSNAEIAAELVLSGATVKTHVAHVLTKTGMRDRVQVVVRAYETGLVGPGDTGSSGGRTH